jgi:hypothetical protein
MESGNGRAGQQKWFGEGECIEGVGDQADFDEPPDEGLNGRPQQR